MGGQQSRVASSDVETELHAGEAGHEGEVRASIRLTPALVQQIQNPDAAGGAAPLDAQQQAAIKKQLQLAYAKGAEDFRKEMEAKQKQGGETDPVKQARIAKEQEARENARVAALIAEINQKKYRAPINDVQCSPEREACLQCYRDQQGNVLACKEVADAFARCAQLHTEKFVKDE